MIVHAEMCVAPDAVAVFLSPLDALDPLDPLDPLHAARSTTQAQSVRVEHEWCICLLTGRLVMVPNLLPEELGGPVLLGTRRRVTDGSNATEMSFGASIQEKTRRKARNVPLTR